MRNYALRGFWLLFGSFLFAPGVVLAIRANVGYAPWDVFHAGLARVLGISFGVTSIIVGIVIIAIDLIARENIGVGTVLSLILTGLFIDLIFFLDIIPLAPNFAVGVVMLIVGFFVMSIGTYFYIKSAFGAGPRDTLMVVLKRKTKLPIGVCRSILELTVTLAGWLLGGMVGIGTLISIVTIGFCIQITFAAFRFKVTEVRHETFTQTYKIIRAYLKKEPDCSEPP